VLPNSDRNFEKSFKKPLTFSQKCDRMNMKREEGKPHKPERITTMKKATMNTILSLIANIDTPEANDVRAELNAELNKGAEEKARNAELYASAKEVVMDELSLTDKAVTISELYDAVADKLPEGMTKGKLQYAVTRLWVGDGIAKVEGKVNTYCKA
jgi:hypothetical protein